jgi:hypothetical protein
VSGRRLLIPLMGLLTSVTIVACLPLGLDGGCSHTLDQETLERLTLSMERTVQMRPGETREFSLGVVECCYVFEPVDACATWSVSPGAGATIDSETGVLVVDSSTPSGEAFTVTADVEEERRLVSIDVYVYTPEDNPLVGNWREEVQLACQTWQELAPEEPVGELQFRADGSFSVTWMPFEIYRDYWGSYRYDLEEGSLDLATSGGNYVPEDVDGSGSWEIDEEGRLILRDMWLGTPHGASGTANCGHRFVR